MEAYAYKPLVSDNLLCCVLRFVISLAYWSLLCKLENSVEKGKKLALLGQPKLVTILKKLLWLQKGNISTRILTTMAWL